MSAVAISPAAADPRLAGDVLAHLDAQLASAQRLLQAVLAQGAAIRAQDVDGVVRQVAAFQAELERRARLEEDRARLLARAGAQLGLPAGAVTLSQLAALMPAADAQLAHARSAELNGLLAELTREHACNQALMRQELAFLDHLLRLVDPAASTDAGAYTAGGIRPAHVPFTAMRSAPRALDLQA
jgi:flagellar FlgN protein